MQEFTDQLQRKIYLTETPRRIISLVPSQTELLYDLGLWDEVVGITKFCVHPESWFRSKTRIGGTKNLDLKKIISLKPDLIIGNKEENEKAQIEALMQHFPVWMSDIKNLDDAYHMIGSIGELVQKRNQAKELVEKIETAFEKIPLSTPKTCVYLIWKNPYLCAGDATFIDSMLRKCNLQSVFSGRDRYPEISPKELRKAKPEIILLSSEPYPFKTADHNYLKRICPDADIYFVDGEYFSWYGSRLLGAARYFTQFTTKFSHLKKRTKD